MSDQRVIPAKYIQTELIDHNSRFITNGGPAFSVNDAQKFIKEIQEKYPDASHHVPAYIIGHGQSTIAHCSDDGEPSGTAGRPALSVLKGSGIGDIVVVVTRYFGGTKLGTGGLVRAYSDSVRELLDSLPLAKRVATTTVMFVIPYTHFAQAMLISSNHSGHIRDKAFGADVTLTVRLTDEHLESFREKMVELTHGQIEFIVLEQRNNTIMPL